MDTTVCSVPLKPRNWVWEDGCSSGMCLGIRRGKVAGLPGFD